MCYLWTHYLYVHEWTKIPDKSAGYWIVEIAVRYWKIVKYDAISVHFWGIQKMSMNNTLNCFILHQKCLFLTKEKRRKSLICSVLLILNFGSSGATGIRTRDTRIFSPLLYQLSYGTIVMLCLTFLKRVQRYTHFFILQIFLWKFLHKFCAFLWSYGQMCW